MFKQIIILLATLALSINAFAKDLTNQEIENWLKASPEISKWLNQHKTILDKENKINFLEASPSEVSSYANRVLKKHNLYDQLQGNLDKYGFNDLERFFEVQTQVIQAYMAVSIAQANIPSSMNKELMNTLAEIEQEEGLTAEQKAQMKAQITEMMGQVMKMQNRQKNQIDQETIKPYFEKIAATFEQFQ